MKNASNISKKIYKTQNSFNYFYENLANQKFDFCHLVTITLGLPSENNLTLTKNIQKGREIEEFGKKIQSDTNQIKGQQNPYKD